MSLSFTQKLAQALEIAGIIHEQQKDLSGASYIGHINRVYNNTTDLCHYANLDTEQTQTAKIVSILHDTIEDVKEDKKEMLLHSLKDFGDDVIESIYLLSKNTLDCEMGVEGIHDIYYTRLLKSNNTIAKIVKLADLTDNLNFYRLIKQDEISQEKIDKLLSNAKVVGRLLKYMAAYKQIIISLEQDGVVFDKSKQHLQSNIVLDINKIQEFFCKRN